MLYQIWNPAGNLTALVAEEVSVVDQPRIAGQIMENEPTVEQVGFVTRTGSGISLRMAGGEFCGNATMCAAAMAASENGASGEQQMITVAASGVDHPLPVRVEYLGENRYRTRIPMPRPLGMELIKLESREGEMELPLVDLGGIGHLIRLQSEEPCQWYEEMIKTWCKELQLPALGIMFIDEQTDSLIPLVYVDDPETLFWEHSCASGTTAAVWYLEKTGNRRTHSYSFHEPGGQILAEVDEDGQIYLTQICTR